jgi:hypothetical protein
MDEIEEYKKIADRLGLTTEDLDKLQTDVASNIEINVPVIDIIEHTFSATDSFSLIKAKVLVLIYELSCVGVIRHEQATDTSKIDS